MTDNKGELVPASRKEMAEQKNPFEVLLEERFKNFTKELTSKKAPFVYVPRVDNRKERFPMDLRLTQTKCVFWDVISDNEEGVLSRHELLRKPYGDLQREKGDSLDFPINTLGRVALREIKNKSGDTVWAYTIEVGGKIDTKEANSFSDYVAQGVTRGIPSYIQINIANRSREDLAARLDLALHLVEPNLFGKESENDLVKKLLPEEAIPQKTNIPNSPDENMEKLRAQIEAMTNQYLQPPKPNKEIEE